MSLDPDKVHIIRSKVRLLHLTPPDEREGSVFRGLNFTRSEQTKLPLDSEYSITSAQYHLVP